MFAKLRHMLFSPAPPELKSQPVQFQNPMELYYRSFLLGANSIEHGLLIQFYADMHNADTELEGSNRRIAFRWYIAAWLASDHHELAEQLCSLIISRCRAHTSPTMNPSENMFIHISETCPELINEIKEFSNNDPQWRLALVHLLREESVSSKLKKAYKQIQLNYFSEKERLQKSEEVEVLDAKSENRSASTCRM